MPTQSQFPVAVSSALAPYHLTRGDKPERFLARKSAAINSATITPPPRVAVFLEASIEMEFSARTEIWMPFTTLSTVSVKPCDVLLISSLILRCAAYLTYLC
jgi:hypothetical protein